MNANLCQVGTDCGRFPHSVLKSAGIAVPDLPTHWPRDFMCHAMADAEPYIALIQQALVEVDAPLPGDLAVFKPPRSRCFSHAALVSDWPMVIHASSDHRRVVESLATEWPLAGCPVRFFSPFGAK
jgi:hypothetical protein